MATDEESFEKSIRIPHKKDHFNSVRNEYSQMLRTQLAQGNNGLTKTKYLTFGIEADSMRQAKPRLQHVQNDILNNFRQQILPDGRDAWRDELPKHYGIGSFG